MFMNSIRKTLGAVALAAVVTLGVSTTSQAQQVSEHSDHFAIGIGGGVNTNMANGTFDPTNSGSTFYREGDYQAPSFHVMAEIPLADRITFQPRVSYNDYSSVLDDNGRGVTIDRGDFVGYSYKTIGADLLMKVKINSGFHALAGGSISKSIENRVARGVDNITAASRSQQSMPDAPEFYSLLTAGAGYDIDLSGGGRSMWITPEVTFNRPLVNLAQGGSDGNLGTMTLASKVSLKFGLDQLDGE